MSNTLRSPGAGFSARRALGAIVIAAVVAFGAVSYLSLKDNPRFADLPFKFDPQVTSAHAPG